MNHHESMEDEVKTCEDLNTVDVGQAIWSLQLTAETELPPEGLLFFHFRVNGVLISAESRVHRAPIEMVVELASCSRNLSSDEMMKLSVRFS